MSVRVDIVVNGTIERRAYLELTKLEHVLQFCAMHDIGQSGHESSERERKARGGKR